MGDTVMVTGGLGQIGSHACRALVASGRTPVIYDAGSDTRMISDIASQCVVLHGTVDDLPRLLAFVAQHKPVAILHLAAQVSDAVEKFPWSALQTNLLGTVNMFEAARLGGVPRVVFISSKNVYGHIGERHRHPVYDPVTEDHPREPFQMYGKLKRATEDVADHYAPLYGLDLIALRFASSYGPAGPGRHKVLVSKLVEAAILKQPMHVEKGGDQRDQFCYSAEAANALQAALESAPRPGRFRAYNISSGELLSLAEIVEILKEEHPGWEGSAGPGLDYRGTGLGHYFAMDIARARSEIGFTPKFQFREAARHYARLFHRIRSDQAA